VKIHEYQAKEIFASYGIPTPKEKLATTPDEIKTHAKEIGLPVVVKAQVHVGGRGKAGGIKLATDESELEKATQILGMRIKGIEVKKVLVAEAISIKGESYLGFIVDRSSQKIVAMASSEGGVEIEEVARRNPKAIQKLYIDPLLGIQPYQMRTLATFLYGDKGLIKSAIKITQALYQIMVEKDCSLIEINPLVRTEDGRLIALDAKINFDDNGLYRHPEIESLRDLEAEDRNEIDAREYGLSYVRLDGKIGCVVNGAGLAMATMDLVKHFGEEPANFLDIGGSSSPEKVKNALSILLRDENVKVILFNIFGGITRCDDVAQGILQARDELKIAHPIVVRLTGTNEAQARELLKESGLLFATGMEEAARLAIEKLRGV